MSRCGQRSTRRFLPALLVAAALLLACGGCSGDGRYAPLSSTTPPQTTTAPAPTTEATTPAPEPPVVGPGPCPYLEETYIEEAVGDRMDHVETVTVQGQPAPDCIFYLLNGSVGVTVDLTPFPDPVAAQNAALALVTSAALPLTDLGDYGGVLVSPGSTLLAVTTGPLLVAVQINKESSLEAREIAQTALAALPVG